MGAGHIGIQVQMGSLRVKIYKRVVVESLLNRTFKVDGSVEWGRQRVVWGVGPDTYGGTRRVRPGGGGVGKTSLVDR